MKMIKLGLMIALILCSTSLVRAQRSVVVSNALEKALKVKDPKRKLKKIKPADIFVRQEWKSDGQHVVVKVFEYASSEEAARRMAHSLSGRTFWEVSENLTNLGDAATVTTTRQGTTTHLLLRKGNVLVFITTESLKVAKKFARDIADELKLK